MEGLSPVKFVCEELLNYENPGRVSVAEGVPIDDGASPEVDEDADPVGVVVVDREAKMIEEERVDTAAMIVDAKPGKTSVTLKGAAGSNGRVKVGGEAEEGVLMGRRGGEGGEKGAEVVNGYVVEPPSGGDGVKEVRGGKGPKLVVVVEGELMGGGVRLEEGS